MKNVLQISLSVFLSYAISGYAALSIQTRHGVRTITADALPSYSLKDNFPNHCNPNAASKQKLHFTVPVNPSYKKNAIYYRAPFKFGIAINGVPFDPEAAEYWSKDHNTPCNKNDARFHNAWPYNALSPDVNLGLDKSHGHVQPNGTYHYHGLPTQLIASLPSNTMQMVGYAADGFPIYSNLGYESSYDVNSKLKKLASSYQLKAGRRPVTANGPTGKYDGRFQSDYYYKAGSGDLDECNGKFGATPEYPKGTYFYVITDTYPFIGRCFHGVPDSSFMMSPGHHRPPPIPKQHDR